MNSNFLMLAVVFVAVFIYQEWSRRDLQRKADAQQRATEERYEAKLKEAEERQRTRDEQHEAKIKQVAEREYAHGLAAGGEQVQTYEFRREVKRKVLFFSIEQELFLFVTFYRDKVKHVHGDVSNFELFELPAAIKTAIEAARRAGEVVAAVHQIPKIAA